MRNLFSVVSVFIFTLMFAACGPDHNSGNDAAVNDDAGQSDTGPVRLTGGAQKGPYQPGSPVSCTRLDAQGYPTAETFSTTTDATGMFTLNVDPGVYQCQASGFYWKEDEGRFSGSSTVMYALVNVKVSDDDAGAGGANTVFINPRTNFVAKRAIALIATIQDGGVGMDPDQAILQAESEINGSEISAMGFSLPPPASLPLSTSMNLLGGDNAANREVFRVDCALMYASQIKAADPSERDAQLQLLLNRGALEMANSGAFSNDFRALIAQAETVMNPEVCTTYLQMYVTDSGLSGIVLPNLQAVIDSDGNGVANADQPDPEMVEVPAGSFWMGCGGTNPVCSIDPSIQNRENPYHEVSLSAFKIDRFEVTVGHYKACASCTPPITSGVCTYNGSAFLPINCVTWEQARAYCEWAGKRLPTEAEWEYAARGSDGRPEPWGDGLADCDHAVIWNNSLGCNTGGPMTVGSKPAGRSPFGVFDMVGNVSEYVHDYFDAAYYSSSPGTDPQGPDSGTDHVVRGGSFRPGLEFTDDGPIARRTDTELFYESYGFRCAKDAQ